MKVGEAKFGSSKKFFNFKDGDNVYRILPALGKLADDGVWSKYYRICWGYRNSEGRMKTFQDCRVVNRQTKMVEVESAAYQKLQDLKAQQQQLKDSGADKATMDKMREIVMRYNIESKHYVNAVNLNGEIGLLKIGHKAKLALDALIKKMREEEAINPLGVEKGIYINFNRTGKGVDTLYQVNPYKRKVKANVNGQDAIIEELVYHTMDSAFISRLDREAFELSELFPAPTAEEVAQIVNGTPADLDEVLAKYKKESKPKSTATSTAATDSGTTSMDLGVQDTMMKSENTGTSTVTVEDSEALSSEASAAPEATTTEATASAPAGDVSGLSDEEFLAKMKGMA